MAHVRVVIPTFNRAVRLRDAVESVCRQSYSDMEVVVVDDGSTDGTASVLEELACSDERIRAISQDNAGAAAARNAGIRAVGEYDFLAFLDSDDLWEPTHLEESLRALQASESIGAVFSRFRTVDHSDKWSEEALAARRETIPDRHRAGRRIPRQGRLPSPCENSVARLVGGHFRSIDLEHRSACGRYGTD